jgi:hypothetical protein
MKGLQNARRFRRFTYWTRYPASVLVLAVNHVMSAFNVRRTSERKDLLWTKDSNYQPKIGETLLRMSTKMHQLPFQEQSNESGEDREASVINDEKNGEVLIETGREWENNHLVTRVGIT